MSEEAVFKIKLEEAEGAGSAPGGTAQPSPQQEELIREIDAIRASAALLGVKDPKKNQQAVEKMLADATSTMLGDAAKKLSPSVLAGISRQVADALMGKGSTASILASVQRLAAEVPGLPGVPTAPPAPVPPVPAVPPGREIGLEDYSGLPRLHDHQVGMGYEQRAGAYRPEYGIQVGRTPSLGKRILAEPLQFPQDAQDAVAMRRREQDEKDRRERQREANAAYHDMYGKASPEEETEKTSGRRRFVGQMAQLGQIAAGFGLPGGQTVGRVAGGAAAGMQAGEMLGLSGGAAAMAGPIGAAVAVAQVVAEEAKKGIHDAFSIANRVVTLDAMGLGRAIGQLTEKVPIVGGVMSSLSGGMFDLLDAVHHTAQRFAGFNPQIAKSLAEFNVRNLMRDIERAQGPQGQHVLEVEEQRQRLYADLQNLLDEAMPSILEAASMLTRFAHAGYEMRSWMPWLAGILPGIMTEIGKHLSSTARNTEETARNTRRRQSVSAWVDEFIHMADADAARDEQAHRNAVRDPVAPPGAAAFPNL